jgi:hypothetical protein
VGTNLQHCEDRGTAISLGTLLAFKPYREGAESFMLGYTPAALLHGHDMKRPRNFAHYMLVRISRISDTQAVADEKPKFNPPGDPTNCSWCFLHIEA